MLVLPITHSPPDDISLAVEMPAAVKRRLQLDNARSWIVLSEWNEFVWPGPDLRPVPGADNDTVAYGMIPSALFALIRDVSSPSSVRAAAIECHAVEVICG